MWGRGLRGDMLLCLPRTGRASLQTPSHLVSQLRLIALLVLTSACGEPSSADFAGESTSIKCDFQKTVLQSLDLASLDRSVAVRDDQPSCQIELETAVRLVPPGMEPDMLAGSLLSRREDGVLVSSLVGENALAVWDSTGRFVRRVGRSGAGPGEFASGIQPGFSSGDTLYVIDNSQQLSVFDSDFRFVRRTLQPHAHRPPNYWFVADDGRRFVSPPPAETLTHHVAEVDAAGVVRRLLVPTAPGTTGASLAGVERLLAYGGGETFWLGPAPEPKQQYQVQEWSLDGVLERTITREAAWFVPHIPGQDPSTVNPPSTYFALLQIDDNGMLHTAIRLTDPKSALARPRGARKLSISERFDVRWEILDPRSGTLLASRLFDDVDSLPMPFISNTNLARIMVANHIDSVFVDLVRWRLISAP